MQDLILTLPCRELKLSFGQSIDEVLELVPNQYIFSESPPERKDIVFNSLGFELYFKYDALKAVSLNIKSESYPFCFKGSCTYLDNYFWTNPNLQLFESVLTKHNFIERVTESGYSNCMLNGRIQYGYFEAPHMSRIGIQQLDLNQL